MEVQRVAVRAVYYLAHCNDCSKSLKHKAHKVLTEVDAALLQSLSLDSTAATPSITVSSVSAADASHASIPSELVNSLIHKLTVQNSESFEAAPSIIDSQKEGHFHGFTMVELADDYQSNKQ